MGYKTLNYFHGHDWAKETIDLKTLNVHDLFFQIFNDQPIL